MIGLIPLAILLVWQIVSFVRMRNRTENDAEIDKQMLDALKQYCIRIRMESDGDMHIVWYLPKFRRDPIIDNIVKNWYEQRSYSTRILILKEKSQ